MAESTGRLPPTPTDQSAANTPIAAKLGDPAAIRPNTPVTPMVRLKAHRRPKMSHPKPQKTAPKRRPIFCDSVRSGARVGWNSFLTGVKMSDVTMGQRLSDAQPKPITMKSCCSGQFCSEHYNGTELHSRIVRRNRSFGLMDCEAER